MTPTRATPSTKTLLDIIISKSDDTKIIESGVIELGISDHSMVYTFVEKLVFLDRINLKL